MTTLALAACNDEMIDEIADNNNNNVPVNEESSAVLADDVKVYPLLYTNFQNAHDVEITAADTSSMVVKSALLDAMQVELEPGNVISVWTAPEDIPFMRRIEAISKEGGNLRLHTRNVGLDEVLKEAHLEFDSQVYTNADELPRLADGTINDRFYLSEHDGVYHPTALWYHTQQEDAQLRGRMLTRGAADEEVLALGYDRERTLIVDDMGQTRGSLDLGVNFKAEVSNLTRPIVVAEDTIASIGLQQISEHIAQNVQKKMELLEKVTLAQVKAVFNKCIYSDGFTITEALQAHRIPTDPVIVKDLENIRAEREKHLEYGVRTNTLNQEDKRDYHTPWFQAFGKN